MRIYDPRVGRFLSVDPLTKGYPMLSTYQFASNTPILAIDLDVKEAWVAYIEHYNNSKTPMIHLEFEVDLKNIKAIYEVHRYYDKDNKVESISTGSTSF